MKTLRVFSMLAAAVLSMTMISSCNHDLDPDDASNSEVIRRMNQMNRSVSMDGDIEFQILTPNGLVGVGWKSFTMSAKEDGDFKDLDGTSFFSVISSGRYANDMFSIMAYSQNLSKSQPGDKLDLKRVSCGNFLSSNIDIAFATFEGGDIYVKNISDATITLRFVKIKGSNALGDFYFNGDLAFDIE
ncbi:MAG: hypothetical protein MJY80_01330 [Bacteroidales bacterium]|nr:hypothetical protein [Bacteroidales bacterium]